MKSLKLSEDEESMYVQIKNLNKILFAQNYLLHKNKKLTIFNEI